MADFNDIKVTTKEDMIGVITIDRPPVNVLGSETWGEILDAYKAFDEDPEIRVIILTGGGEKMFSAGADLKGGLGGGGGDVKDSVAHIQGIMDAIESGGTPVIAALNGPAYGGGCELALACHYRYADPDMKIGLTESNLGIMPGAGGVVRMTRLLGVKKALNLMIFGKRVPASEALEMGLVDEVTESGKALEGAMAFARELCTRPPLSTKYIIRATYATANVSHKAGLEGEQEGWSNLIQSQDAMEGIRAFFNKTEPTWTGR